jgi:hypothetical protein
MDVTQLVRQAGTESYPSSARGYILAAPISFDVPLDVILPAGSTERHYGPCAWGAIHGATLPAAGAECVVVFDEQNQPTVVWWQGSYSDSGWLAPAYEHSWKAKAGSLVGYRKQGNVVRLRGRIESGETSQAAFTLPAGFRPTQQAYQGVIQGGVVMGFLIVETSGAVVPGTEGAKTPSLDGVTFTVD